MKNKLKIAISLFIFLLSMSCQNEDSEIDNKTVTVGNAKKWLEINKPKLQALNYTETIDWKNAIVIDGNTGKIVEVPLILVPNTVTNIGENSSYKTYMRLLFLEKKDKTYDVQSLIITTKDLAFDNANKEFHINKFNPDYSGYLTLQNSENKILYSGKYEKGKKIRTPRRTKETSKWVCSYIITVGTYSTCKWDWVMDADDPEWLLAQWGWTNYDPNMGGGGGGDPWNTDPWNPDPEPDPSWENVDPCTKATMITNSNIGSEYRSALNSIIAASSDGLEHSITLGKNGWSQIIQSPMNTGGTHNVKVNTSLLGAFATIHNHPTVSPLSSGDIYTSVTLNTLCGGLETSFIVLPDGSTYAIVVTDLTASQNFVATYPADLVPGYNAEFPDFILDQIKAIETSSMAFSSTEGKTQAISIILDKYNSGIKLMKQDSAGTFNTIYLEQTINNGVITYKQKPCN
jgi:hypothetical protein